MTENIKLTRGQACAELLGRQQLGRQAVTLTNQQLPDYFTDRDAVASLVLWIKGQNIDLRESFQQHFQEIVTDASNARFVRFFDALLATPEQIALAACRALKINVE